MSTTTANAYVRPMMERYLVELERRLRRAGARSPLRIMTSSGGFTSSRTAARQPIALLESGPAGGGAERGQHCETGRHRRCARTRHGRHHRQGLRRGGRTGGRHPQLRGGAGQALHPREWPADVDPQHRSHRDRRRRRLHRRDQPLGVVERGPRERGRAAGARLLPPGGHATDGDRRGPDPGVSRPGSLPRRRDEARRRACTKDVGRFVATTRARFDRDCLGDTQPGEREHGGCGPRACRRERPRPAPLHPGRDRRGRPGACDGGGAQARDAPHPVSGGSRGRLVSRSARGAGVGSTDRSRRWSCSHGSTSSA